MLLLVAVAYPCVLLLLLLLRHPGILGSGDRKGQKDAGPPRPRGPTAIGAAAQHYGEGWDMFRVRVWRPRRGSFPERYLKTPPFHPTPQPPSAPGGAKPPGAFCTPPYFKCCARVGLAQDTPPRKKWQHLGVFFQSRLVSCGWRKRMAAFRRLFSVAAGQSRLEKKRPGIYFKVYSTLKNVILHF